MGGGQVADNMKPSSHRGFMQEGPDVLHCQIQRNFGDQTARAGGTEFLGRGSAFCTLAAGIDIFVADDVILTQVRACLHFD